MMHQFNHHLVVKDDDTPIVKNCKAAMVQNPQTRYNGVKRLLALLGTKGWMAARGMVRSAVELLREHNQLYN